MLLMCCVRCRARVAAWKGSGLGSRMKLTVETRCDCSTLVSEGGACWSYSRRLTLAGGWAQARPNCKHTEDWLKTLSQTKYSLCMLDTGASPTRPLPRSSCMHSVHCHSQTHTHTHLHAVATGPKCVTLIGTLHHAGALPRSATTRLTRGLEEARCSCGACGLPLLGLTMM